MNASSSISGTIMSKICMDQGQAYMLKPVRLDILGLSVTNHVWGKDGRFGLLFLGYPPTIAAQDSG